MRETGDVDLPIAPSPIHPIVLARDSCVGGMFSDYLLEFWSNLVEYTVGTVANQAVDMPTCPAQRVTPPSPGRIKPLGYSLTRVKIRSVGSETNCTFSRCNSQLALISIHLVDISYSTLQTHHNNINTIPKCHGRLLRVDTGEAGGTETIHRLHRGTGTTDLEIGMNTVEGQIEGIGEMFIRLFGMVVIAETSGMIVVRRRLIGIREIGISEEIQGTEGITSDTTLVIDPLRHFDQRLMLLHPAAQLVQV
jgi:hypothetical protein